MTPAGPCTAQPEVLRYDSPVLAAGAQALDEYKYVGESDYYVCAISNLGSPVGFTMRFRDSEGRYLTNTPLQGVNTAQQLTLEPPMRIPEGGRIGIELVNGTLVDVQTSLLFVGFRKFYEDRMNPFSSPAELGVVGDTPAGFRDEPFVYNFDVASIAGSTAPGQLPLKIDADADFIWRAGAFTADSGTATAIRLRFTDGQGRYRMNTRIPIGLLFGQTLESNLPIFPEIHLPASSVVYFDIENTDVGAITNFQLSMMGVKRSPR